MSEEFVTNLGRVELDLNARRSQQAAKGDPAVRAAQERAAQAAENPTGVAEQAARTQKTGQEQAQQKPVNPMTDLSLKFQVDAETRDVTILLLDRATRKVVRTIPPDEMQKIDPGELLSLFA